MNCLVQDADTPLAAADLPTVYSYTEGTGDDAVVTYGLAGRRWRR